MTIFWMRRDLRLEDNAALFYALRDHGNVLPVFIFDRDILNRLNNPLDRRVWFIYEQVLALRERLREHGSDMLVCYGVPEVVFEQILKGNLLPQVKTNGGLKQVLCNHDYEPLAIERDLKVETALKLAGVGFKSFKDQVIFERDEILTDSRNPYTVYTPYKKKWVSSLSDFYLKSYPVELYLDRLYRAQPKHPLPETVTLEKMGFSPVQGFVFPSVSVKAKLLKEYAEKRDFPALGATSLLGIHLRFGTVSVRELARAAKATSDVWLSELIWREFFMQILFHFPKSATACFRPDYEKIRWRDAPEDFERWCAGTTGFPLVDAGMRELIHTGHMHNRVRMLVASFLTKHLLIHWRAGERHFAAHLLDFELASNVGNWQWAAGTGCDAAPYFRIFNPSTQIERFDEQRIYIKKWVPEFGTAKYPPPMVDHAMARERCLREFKLALKGNSK